MPPRSDGARRDVARGRGAGVKTFIIGVTLLAGGAVGCDAGREKASTNANASADASAKGDADASANGDADASARAGAEPHAGSGERTSAGGPGMPLCKIMSSEGGPAATADATRWLDVPAKASFTVRTLETGRELRFEGPGRVRACGDDVALVPEGAAVGLPGSGEAPGAEQWAATACGVVRWASGVHRFTGARDACRLQSSLGTAHLWVAEDVRADDVPFDVDAGSSRGGDGHGDGGDGDGGHGDGGHGGGDTSPWRRVDAKRAIRLHARGPLDGAAAVKSALASCEKAANDVQSLASRMNAADAGSGSLGDLAAQSVTARGLARASCATAAVRVALAGSRGEDQARLDAATARWRAPR